MKKNITKLENIEIIVHMSSYKTDTSIELHFLDLIISIIYDSHQSSPYNTIEQQYSFLKNPIYHERSNANNNL
jgi:hypothetical protein